MKSIKSTLKKLKILLCGLICAISLLFPVKSNGIQPTVNETTITDSSKTNSGIPVVKAAPELKNAEFNSRIGKRQNYLFGLLPDHKNLLEIKNELINYGNQYLPLSFRRFYFRVVEKSYSYPIIVLFILSIFFFGLNILLVLLVIYLSNKRKNHRDKYTRIFQNMYEEVLRDYLFGVIDWDKALIQLKRIKKPLNRKILTRVLYNFQDNFRGEMDSQIGEIFFRLELHKDALKSAKSSFYYNKIRGILELTNLYPKLAEKIIERNINHSNHLIREVAQTSYIRLHPDKPFDFFRSMTNPFTQWTQLSAFYLFRLHQLPVPLFAEYLDSPSLDVRNFCIRMITYFQQFENEAEIYEMAGNQTELSRFFAIHAINELRLTPGKNIIRSRYPIETNKNKEEIIRAFKNIGNAEDFDFLESIIHTGSVTLKKEACRTMYFMSQESRERLISLKQETQLNIEEYIAHITDPRN